MVIKNSYLKLAFILYNFYDSFNAKLQSVESKAKQRSFKIINEEKKKKK